MKVADAVDPFGMIRTIAVVFKPGEKYPRTAYEIKRRRGKVKMKKMRVLHLY